MCKRLEIRRGREDRFGEFAAHHFRISDMFIREIEIMESFPVGYYDFSKDEALNFQLNRFYSSRTFSYEERMEIGAKVNSFEE